ncbi:hypothetical protein C5167_036110 [Papaver somniferum]|nr:hypothetical protein C5167_036110 [Papaver somniferum]
MKESAYISDDGDDNIYCSNMDYQLHCQGGNFLSLKSFIPDGVAGVDNAAYKELISQKEHPPYTACVFAEGGSGVYFPYF